MKTITPAYSVIALIVLVGYSLALAGYPASAFAQEEANTTDQAADSDETVDVEVVSEDVVSKNLDSHPYKIDKLRTDKVYSDFVVGPGRFQLQVAPGESKTVEMIVTNRMGIPKTFTLTTEDMQASSNDDGTVTLLGDQVGPYSIKDFISVPQYRFVLNHQERAHIPVTITIPADAEPGGFYGSLLTQIVSEDANPEVSGVVSGTKLVSRIGTLFFVTTPGEIERELELKKFSTLGDRKFLTKGPVNLSIVTENTGSVHATPYGTLRITNTLGNEVGYVELNTWYVLPNSIRNRDVQWDREFLWGRYTAELELNRGYGDIVDKATYTFWVIPLELLAAVFGGFFILFLAIRFFFSQFEFKRKDK